MNRAPDSWPVRAIARMEVFKATSLGRFINRLNLASDAMLAGLLWMVVLVWLSNIAVLAAAMFLGALTGETIIFVISVVIFVAVGIVCLAVRKAMIAAAWLAGRIVGYAASLRKA